MIQLYRHFDRSAAHGAVELYIALIKMRFYNVLYLSNNIMKAMMEIVRNKSNDALPLNKLAPQSINMVRLNTCEIMQTT